MTAKEEYDNGLDETDPGLTFKLTYDPDSGKSRKSGNSGESQDSGSGGSATTASGICTLCRKQCPLSAPRCNKPYEAGLL